MNFFKKKISEPEKTQQYFKKKYPNYKLGKNTYGFPTVFDWHEGSTLEIGHYCSISANVKIYLGGHHRMDWISTYPFPAFFNDSKHIENYGGSNGNVSIGSDVCIYANVTILSGVHIGNGAVIANGSVVTKNVEDYEIVGGNPAKHIRYRFDEETITNLLRIAWWDWQEDEILNISNILCSDNLAELFLYSKNRKIGDKNAK